MTIARVRLLAYSVRLPEPWPSAEGSVDRREGLILFLEDGEGRIGIGESAPFPGFGLETIASSGAALRLAAGRIVGLTLPSAEAAAAELPRLAPVAACPSARHAIDLALHDLAAQTAGVSIARLLGGDRALTEVEVNAVIPRLDPDRAAERASAAVARGVRTIKVKIGGGVPDEEVQRVRAVREAVGASIRVRADANQAWSAEEAIAILRRLAPYDLEYVEQPVAADSTQAMARVRRACGIRIAADESLTGMEAARRLIEAAAADVFIVKPMALGGLRAARDVAAFAAANGVVTVVTALLESIVGRTGALHCAASLGHCPHAHGVAGGFMPGEGPVVEAAGPFGVIPVPAGAGLGVAMARDRVLAAEALATAGDLGNVR